MLNQREIDFANNYIISPNAYQAAIDAGYAESTAKDASKWINPDENPKKPNKFKPELYDYIQKLRAEDDRRDKAIMTRAEKKRILAAIARDPKASPQDRCRALDIDNKMDGEYTTKIQADIESKVKLEDLL